MSAGKPGRMEGARNQSLRSQRGKATISHCPKNANPPSVVSRFNVGRAGILEPSRWEPIDYGVCSNGEEEE